MEQTAANNELVEKFFPQIFEMEANGILQDLAGVPDFMFFTMGLPYDTQEQVEKAVNRARKYLIDVFETCYRCGELRIAIQTDGDKLHAYVLIFVDPTMPELPAYIHKIFVFEQYRKQGIGSGLLQQLAELDTGVALLCSPDLIPFYESAGFKQGSCFMGQGAPDNMSKTKLMYAGLMLMVSPNAKTQATSIFMINDKDVDQIKLRMFDPNR